jgi:hypothetical protein
MRVLSDILFAFFCGDPVALVLLDSSVAFDMVDPQILLQRNMITYGIDDNVYRWFKCICSVEHNTIAVDYPGRLYVVCHKDRYWDLCIHYVQRQSNLAD